MNAHNLDLLLYHDVELHSGHEARRQYIGLSNISECQAVLYQRYMGTSEVLPPPVSHTMAQYSVELEHILATRLQRCGVYQPGTTITLYEGLVQGHTDGWVEKSLLEIATVQLPDHFPIERIPRRKYQQIQAYLHYTGSVNAIALYFARRDGTWRAYDVPYNLKVAQQLAAKVERLVACIKTDTPAPCTCAIENHDQ